MKRKKVTKKISKKVTNWSKEKKSKTLNCINCKTPVVVSMEAVSVECPMCCVSKVPLKVTRTVKNPRKKKVKKIK